MSHKISRRGFLIAITGSAVAAAAGCRPDGIVAPTPYVPGSSTNNPNLPTSTPAPTLDASKADPDPNYGQVTYDKIFTTSADQLYVTEYADTPTVDMTSWSFKVDGLVENPMTYTYDKLKAFDVYEDMRTLECIGNPVGGSLIGNILWRGLRFQNILDQIKLKPEATYAKFECADGYSTSVKLDWITQPDVMLAYDMNGGPLTQVHGYPLRILMPGLYGQKMPRWLTHIEFINQDYIGFWESNGWSDIASVQTNSIIQSPNPEGVPAKAGMKVAIQGLAYAGKRAITKVEISIDNGEWMPAELTHGPSALTWTQWYYLWVPPAPGSYQIAVRATDETGFVQNHPAISVFSDAAPNGTDAIHAITVQAE